MKHAKARPVKRALLSVSDKTGIVEFAKSLAKQGVVLVSTGGTKQAISEAGVDVQDVADVTGFPEIMEGRVKTLHPKVHGGLLAKQDDDGHKAAMSEHGIEGFDLVVVNLYPFRQTVASGADIKTCIENIDIGGPAMIRAAAKNHAYVTVITDPKDYDALLDELKTQDGQTDQSFREQMALKAFMHTAAYDGAIATWFNQTFGDDELRDHYILSGSNGTVLRYGENPHQRAALYSYGLDTPSIVSAKQVQGKELSYNNINDADAAYNLVAEFEEPAVAIIKHANPSGVAVGENMLDAYKKAYDCDVVSAFGGVIALNQALDEDVAAEIAKIFCEVIIAPSVTAGAMEILKEKDKVRVLTTGSVPNPTEPRKMIRSIRGGFMVQDADIGRVTMEDLKVVSEREPTADEMRDMLFAFRVAKYVKSNAIIYARENRTVAIGAGQMSRVDSSKIATQKSIEHAELNALKEPLTKGSVVASDAFFPFADGLIEAAQAGVTAVIQPGGSIRDDEVIEAANERGLAMVFTSMRHFNH